MELNLNIQFDRDGNTLFCPRFKSPLLDGLEGLRVQIPPQTAKHFSLGYGTIRSHNNGQDGRTHIVDRPLGSFTAIVDDWLRLQDCPWRLNLSADAIDLSRLNLARRGFDEQAATD